MSRKKALSVLDRLKPREARSVLTRLLSAHPELIFEAEELARARLAEQGADEFAQSFQRSLMQLKLPKAQEGEDLEEQLWKQVLKISTPFIHDIQRQIGLGLEENALELCKGVLQGLYHTQAFEQVSDFKKEVVALFLSRWARAHSPGRERLRPPFPMQFVDEEMPEWRGWIEHCLNKEA